MNAALTVPAHLHSTITRNDRPGPRAECEIDPDDSALAALTDFRFDYPITVGPSRRIDDALADMKRFAVHCLLVTVDDIDEQDHRVVGLITKYDIERKHPHRCPGSRSRSANRFIVSAVMTPWNELSLVHYDSLMDLTAAELYERFQGTGLTHLLVIEMRIDESAVARGLISRAALASSLRRRSAPCT